MTITLPDPPVRPSLSEPPMINGRWTDAWLRYWAADKAWKDALMVKLREMAAAIP